MLANKAPSSPHEVHCMTSLRALSLFLSIAQFASVMHAIIIHTYSSAEQILALPVISPLQNCTEHLCLQPVTGSVVMGSGVGGVCVGVGSGVGEDEGAVSFEELRTHIPLGGDCVNLS